MNPDDVSIVGRIISRNRNSTGIHAYEEGDVDLGAAAEGTGEAVSASSLFAVVAVIVLIHLLAAFTVTTALVANSPRFARLSAKWRLLLIAVPHCFLVRGRFHEALALMHPDLCFFLLATAVYIGLVIVWPETTPGG